MATAIIVRQEPDQYDFSNPSNPTLGVVVYFQTGDGNDGSVFVPRNRYNAKTVHSMVAAAAKITDEIGNLLVSY